MIGGTLTIGQKVTWMRVSRGGYGHVTPVAAVVIGIGRKLVRIKVKRISYTPGAVILDEKSVSPDSLTQRSNFVQGLDTQESETDK